ncbi:MAG: glycosyltransferase, partial [Candidatus Dormibacteraceae bacterium]
MDSLAVGGAERQGILCVAELRKLGHSADLIYYHPKLEYGEMLDQLQIEPIYVAASSFVRRCRRLRSLFQERNYDVVHGFKMAAEVYAALVGAWAGVPRRFGSFRSIYNLSSKYCLLHFLVDKLLDAWIVNSVIGADSMARKTRISARKIVMLPNGVSAEMFATPLRAKDAKARLGLCESSVVVTMIARLEPGKNHRMLIDAAAQVVGQASKTTFLVVGKGSLERALRDYASQRGLSSNMSFLGQRSDVVEILAATDIAVMSSDFEGLPNSVIESMAAGKPLVCTSYPGYDQIIIPGSTALISPCGQADEFAENILRLILDQSLRSRLASNA